MKTLLLFCEWSGWVPEPRLEVEFALAEDIPLLGDMIGLCSGRHDETGQERAKKMARSTLCRGL